MSTHAENVLPHAELAVAAANKAADAAAQVADTYMQGGARGYRASTDAALFDAACTLRAAADRLDRLRDAHRANVMLAETTGVALRNLQR